MATRTKPVTSADQQLQVDQIKEQYRRRGMPEEEADRRAAATANDIAGGGRKGGSTSGRAKRLNKAPAKYAGQIASPSRRSQARRAKAGAKKGRSEGARGNAKSTNRDNAPLRGRQSPVPIQRLTEDLARQIISREFARMARRGFGKFRVRTYPHDHHVLFQGEKKNRWESLPNGEYDGEKADLITFVMKSIRGKRNDTVQINSRSRLDYQTFEMRVDPHVIQAHASNLPEFFAGQLFWK